MILPLHSQTISKGEIKEIVNSDGDTLIIMRLEDAKKILSDLLDYEIADSLLLAYKENTSLQDSIIIMQKVTIYKLQEKNYNQHLIITNLDSLVRNKDKEIGIQIEIIEIKKKEIKKQKFLKVVGFIGSILLPILTLIATN
mgnify:CR=1 FL=1|jgi:hypothetical protein